RALASLPAAPPAAARMGGAALAIGVSVPLLLRGPALVGSWAPNGFAAPEADLYARVAALSQGDTLLGPAIADGLRERGFSAAVVGAEDPQANNRAAFPALAKAAGELL